MEIIRGGKSRDKTLSVSGLEDDAGQGEVDIIRRMRMILERAAMDGQKGRK